MLTCSAAKIAVWLGVGACLATVGHCCLLTANSITDHVQAKQIGNPAGRDGHPLQLN